VTCRTTVPYAVPLIRPSQTRTMSRTPCSSSFFGSGAVEVTDRLAFDGLVGAVTAAADGTLLVAAQEHLVVLRPDGRLEDGLPRTRVASSPPASPPESTPR
jgi:hypothetical protein